MKARGPISSAIVMVMKVSTLGLESRQNLQRTFGLAVLGYLFGPPSESKRYLKRIKDILDFSTKFETLGDGSIAD